MTSMHLAHTTGQPPLQHKIQMKSHQLIATPLQFMHSLGVHPKSVIKCASLEHFVPMIGVFVLVRCEL
jgi:hypothetical protein